jgi:hypothetical protein
MEKKLEELVMAKIAEKIVSEMDVETVNSFIREIIVAEVSKSIGSYELKRMIVGVVEEQMKKNALILTQEMVKQPENMKKLKQVVNEGVEEGIKRLKQNVTEKLENTFGRSSSY